MFCFPHTWYTSRLSLNINIEPNIIRRNVKNRCTLVKWVSPVRSTSSSSLVIVFASSSTKASPYRSSQFLTKLKQQNYLKCYPVEGLINRLSMNTGVRRQSTEWAGVAVTTCTRIRKVLISNTGRNTGYSEPFRGCRQSLQITAAILPRLYPDHF
jgi:hypothetical protein